MTGAPVPTHKVPGSTQIEGIGYWYHQFWGKELITDNQYNIFLAPTLQIAPLQLRAGSTPENRNKVQAKYCPCITLDTVNENCNI